MAKKLKPIRYFLEDDDQEILKCDQADNWYVFRHGGWWPNSRPIEERIATFTQYETLGAAKEAALESWLQAFEKLKIYDRPQGFNKKNLYYSPGDEKAPFWSEGFLYPLLGKEDARTVLACLRRLKDISDAY